MIFLFCLGNPNNFRPELNILIVVSTPISVNNCHLSSSYKHECFYCFFGASSSESCTRGNRCRDKRRPTWQRLSMAVPLGGHSLFVIITTHPPLLLGTGHSSGSLKALSVFPSISFISPSPHLLSSLSLVLLIKWDLPSFHLMELAFKWL